MNPSFLDTLREITGPDQVLSGEGALYPYVYDAALDKRWPGAVVVPTSEDQVAAIVRAAWDHGVPYVVRGAGTSLCGAVIAPDRGLVIHISRLNRILSIDPDRRRAWVQPGVVNLHLHRALAPKGLFYAPDPASQKACTLGGNVGTNAGGPHCLKYGVTSHHVTGLRWVRPDGTMGETSVDDPGCDVTGLLVGSEGTLGVATRIELNLLPRPLHVRTFLSAFSSMEAAAHTVADIVAAGVVPATLEVMDRLTLQAVEAFVHAGYPTGAGAVLLMEVDGDEAQTREEGDLIHRLCFKNGGMDFRAAQNEQEREKLWEGRRGAYAAMARLAPNVLVEDGVVPRSRLPEAVRRIRAIADRAGLRMGLIAHAGDGNLHPNVIFDERDRAETARVMAAGQDMLRVCVDLGGSISGEHGVGADKREAMRWLFSPATLSLFRGIKQAVDPDNVCNPDKIIPVVEKIPGPRAVNPARDGTTMVSSVEEAVDYVRASREVRRSFVIRGRGTKCAPARPSSRVLGMSGLESIVDLDRENFTLTLQAGADLEKVRHRVEDEGLYLWVGGSGSVGGALACNASLRPPLRQEILGLTSISGEGEVLSFGAKVMKNVAGYDAGRLFIGSWGVLGPVVEVTFKLHSRPESLATAPPVAPPSDGNGAEWTRRLKSVFDPLALFNKDLIRER